MAYLFLCKLENRCSGRGCKKVVPASWGRFVAVVVMKSKLENKCSGRGRNLLPIRGQLPIFRGVGASGDRRGRF